LSCSTEFFPTLSKYTCPLLAAGWLAVASLVACRRPVVLSTPAPMRRCRERLSGYPMHSSAHEAVCANGGSCAESCAFVSARSDSHACHICSRTGPTPATSAPGLGSPRASVNSRSDAHACHHLRPHRWLRGGQLRRANHMAWPGTTQVLRRTSISCSSDISIPSCQACARMHDGGTRCSWTISNEWCADHT
jgi:hypothetical protein